MKRYLYKSKGDIRMHRSNGAGLRRKFRQRKESSPPQTIVVQCRMPQHIFSSIREV
jgi:hypothetical protein